MITIASIQRAVAQEFQLPERVMREPRPDRRSGSNAYPVSRPRQIAMALSYLLTDQSQTVIGQKFGGRDHTTVMHARRSVEKRRRADPALNAMMRRVTLEVVRAAA